MSVLTLTSSGAIAGPGGALGSNKAMSLYMAATMAEAAHVATLRTRADAAEDDPSRVAFGERWAKVQNHLYTAGAGDVLAGLRARADGFEAGMGGTGAAANLTALMWKLIPQVQPKQNYREFQVSSTLAPGMQQYQLGFEAATGEAQVWAGGAGGIQPLAAGYSFVNRPQYHFITEAPVGFVEEATFAAMGSNLRQALQKQAVLGHSLVKNRLSFQGGGSDLDCWGLKNYPTLTIDYTGLSLATATGAQIASAIADMITGVEIDSKQAIEVDTVMFPTSLKAKWNVLYPSGAGSDMTLAQWFAENFPRVRIVWANELDDLLASGVHAMFAYQSSGDSAPTIESSPVIYLPEYQRGVGVYLYAYSRHGGMVIGHTVGARLGAIED